MIKNGIVIIALLALTGCKTSHELNLSMISMGMSKQEVRVALKKDSFNLSRVVTINSGISEDKTYPCIGEILAYDNRPKKEVTLSEIIATESDPVKRAVARSRCRYWLYFYNDQLKYIKWGQTSSWNANAEVDSLIVDELRKYDPNKIKTLIKLKRIKSKGLK